MPHIDYFLAPQSPYVYLSGTRPARIAAHHGVQIRYRPLDPAQLFPRTGGKVRDERNPSRNAYATQDRARQAKKLGMPLIPAPVWRSANSAPASYAIIAAQAAGGGDVGGLVFSLSRALWAEDRDFSQDEVIRAALAENGFDPGVAHRGMLTAAETYAANLEEAVARGIFGVPFFAVEEQLFWGQDRLDDLDLYLAGKL